MPRWFRYAGWLMLIVGAASLVRDVSTTSSTLEGSLGWLGLIIDVGLDLFLVVAGLVVVVVARREA